MPLVKQKGNMYDWVSHQHAHLGGSCPHECSYCFVSGPNHERPAKYSGDPHLIEKEFEVIYGSGKTIFIDHMNDLWARDIHEDWIYRVLSHCNTWPDNRYVFQTKNPERYLEWEIIPTNSYLGCTIETDKGTSLISTAPHPNDRFLAMVELVKKGCGYIPFITIEPILDFNVDGFSNMILAFAQACNDNCAPDYFINIGADSKNHNLAEPTKEKLQTFIDILLKNDINIRKKLNLARILEG
jgi:DNA repair photolyase